MAGRRSGRRVSSRRAPRPVVMDLRGRRPICAWRVWSVASRTSRRSWTRCRHPTRRRCDRRRLRSRRYPPRPSATTPTCAWDGSKLPPTPTSRPRSRRPAARSPVPPRCRPPASTPRVASKRRQRWRRRTASSTGRCAPRRCAGWGCWRCRMAASVTPARCSATPTSPPSRLDTTRWRHGRRRTSRSRRRCSPRSTRRTTGPDTRRRSPTAPTSRASCSRGCTTGAGSCARTRTGTRSRWPTTNARSRSCRRSVAPTTCWWPSFACTWGSPSASWVDPSKRAEPTRVP